MDDVVDAGGRLTQTYDWFLNVRTCPTFLFALTDPPHYIHKISSSGLLRRYSRVVLPTADQKHHRHRLYR